VEGTCSFANKTIQWSCSEGNMFVDKQPSGIVMKGNCLLARSPMKRTCLLGNNQPKLELFIDKQLIGIFFFKNSLSSHSKADWNVVYFMEFLCCE
jgi:hypothetical protein